MRNLLCFLLLAAQVSVAQINGLVSDLESKKPLPGATVFINRTTLSSQCDSKGVFSINNIPPGFWDIVVYNEGHELFKSSVRVVEDKRYRLSLELVKKQPAPKTKFKPNEEWNNNLEWFQLALLGTGSNAANSVIKNSKDLLFSKEGESLKAVALRPLIIENMSTGYRIIYHLLNFEAGIEQVKSEGFLLFDSLRTLDPMVRSSWEKARLRTYWGSERHLFRALLDGEVRAQGFELLNATGKKLNKDTLVSPAKLSGYYVIQLKGKTKVTYQMEKGTSGIQQTDQAGQISWLTSNGMVEVNDIGVLFNPQTLAVSGHMALSKLSDDLPYNYFPASSLEEEKMDWKNFALLQEKIYVQTDRDYYYPRENIWFKVYMGYSMPMLRDTLSKTLYVELINPDHRVFRSKVYRIKEGVSWGDFKLPDSLANGEYYLRAYTNWMKNYDENLFFMKHIPILSVNQNLVEGPHPKADPLSSEVALSVKTEKNQYSPRAEIKLDIEVKSATGRALMSQMSVSVTDAFSSVPLTEGKNILSDGFRTLNKMGDTTRYFDEIKYFMERGLSFQGVVKDEKQNPVPAKLDIIQGNMENLISMETDDKGEFMVTGMEFQDSVTFAFKPVNKKGRPLPRVDILQKKVPEFMRESEPLKFNFRQENALQRIQNTITVDDNTILLSEVEVKGKRIDDQSAKKGAIKVYGEPDYSISGDKIGATVVGSNILVGLQGRVPGLSVVEVYTNGVRSVVVRVRGGSSSISQGTSPLILVDGVPFEDPNALIGLSRDMIDHVEVITRAVAQFGSRGTNGVIAIYTKGGAYATSQVAEKNFLSHKIPGYNTPRKFFSPVYANETQDKTPDFRTTIFWKPDLVTGPDGKASVTFYAADIEGRYRIILEGITDKGIPFRNVSFVEVK